MSLPGERSGHNDSLMRLETMTLTQRVVAVVYVPMWTIAARKDYFIRQVMRALSRS
jgi:hypothetical protein